MRQAIHLLLACLLVLQSSAQMIIVIKKPAAGSVTFDVVGAGATSGSGTTISANHTVTNALVNSAVVVIVHWILGATTISSCTYNGNAMTQLWNFRDTVSAIEGSAAFIYANGTGDGTAHSASCTLGFTNTDGVGIQTISFGGVNQSTPARTAVTSQIDTTSGSASLTVSNAVSGDMVIDCPTFYGPTSGITSGQTNRQNQLNINFNNFSGIISTAAATGSTNMSYTFPTSQMYMAFGAVAIRP